jgi:iron-sulfur cluster repair protein YtfE (RIC family)
MNQNELQSVALKAYQEKFKSTELDESSIIEAIKLGYELAKNEQENKLNLIAQKIRETFGSQIATQKKYDDLLKELYQK